MSTSSTPSSRPGSRPGSRAERSRRAGRSGRSRRSFDVTFVLAVVLPLLAALALFLTTPGFGTAYFHPPTTPALAQATVVCPGAVGEGDQVVAGSAGSGSLSFTPQSARRRTAAHGPRVALAANGAATASTPTDPVVISASGEAAPGLVGTRSSTKPAAAAPCTSPRADQWFTGVGAGPTHDSSVVLVNPNPGPAIADITVLGDTGPIDMPALRGIAVPGNASQEIDLGAVMPTSSPLALHAVVERGQVAVAVRDRAAHLVGGASDEDWLPAQNRPARRALVLGIAPGDGNRQLTVANTADREVRATVRLVTADSIFTPDNSAELDIGPESVSRVDVAKILGSVGPDGTVGVQVVADGAITATLRSVVGGDVSIAGRSQRTRTPSSIAVPTGAKHLVVGGATGVGALTVVARDASGKQLSSQRVAISPKQGLTVPLPDGAQRVDVTPERTAFRGSVMLGSGHGTAVVPLPRLRVSSRLPFVKPGLPR